MAANESSWKDDSATGSANLIVSSQRDERLIHGVGVSFFWLVTIVSNKTRFS